MTDSVKVVAGPVKADGVVLRMVELPDGSGRVESWDGKAWVPGGGDAAEILYGIPVSDPALPD
jgi:hypothetical protein